MNFWHRVENNIANAPPGAWLAITGSLFGVIIGAMIPVFKAYVDNLLKKREDRRKVSIFFSHKLMYMISSIQIIQNHFEEGAIRAEEVGGHAGLLTQAMNRIGDEVGFTEENIWAIVQICRSGGMNAFGNLDNQFNVLLRGVDHYTQLRTELQKIMPKVKVVDDTRAVYEIDLGSEDSGEVILRVVELDRMVLTLVEHSKQNKAAAASALKMLLEAKRFPYPKMRLTFDPITGIAPIAARGARKSKVHPGDQAQDCPQPSV